VKTIAAGFLLGIFAPHLSWLAALIACFCIAKLFSGEREA
jgi:hypothetical protein